MCTLLCLDWNELHSHFYPWTFEGRDAGCLGEHSSDNETVHSSGRKLERTAEHLIDGSDFLDYLY